MKKATNKCIEQLIQDPKFKVDTGALSVSTQGGLPEINYPTSRISDIAEIQRRFQGAILPLGKDAQVGVFEITRGSHYQFVLLDKGSKDYPLASIRYGG